MIEIHDIVQQLPPPHYRYLKFQIIPLKFNFYFLIKRTLAFLMQHLQKLSDYSTETNMNTKNLAIVWAPNLLK